MRLAAAAAPAPEGLVELPVPLDQERCAAAEALTGSRPRPDGARYAQLRPAAEWLARTLRIAEAGRLAVIDRWTDLTQPLAPGEVPPVALDQLVSIRRPLEAAPVELFPGLSMV